MAPTKRESSMAPNASPALRSLQQSPLDLLKQKLGRDASLLTGLPTQQVELAVPEGPKIEGYAREAIKIGTIIVGSGDWTLHACTTATNRKSSGLPEVKIFGGSSGFSQPKPHSVADMLDKAELRDEFKVLKGYDANALSVVVKTCMILKGVELPRNFSFTPRFINAIPKVCRRYRDGAERVMSSPIPTSDADSSLPILVKPRVMMRKSEQSGPENQLFGALHRNSQSQEPTGSTTSFTQKTILGLHLSIP